MDPQTEAALALFPQCIQAPALEAITTSGCGLDLKCICTNDRYLVALQGALLTQCNPTDQSTVVSLSKQLCTSAIPSLKENQDSLVIASLSVLLAFMALSVVLRLASRRLTAAKIGSDDYFMFAGAVATIGIAATTIICLRYGLGKHQITLSITDGIASAKCWLAVEIMFMVAMSLIKLSMLFLYSRIFPSETFKTILYLMGAIIIAACVGSEGAVIFQCRPVSYFWDKNIPGGHCVSQYGVNYAPVVFNIATDIAVLVLPLPILWKLQMPLGRKMGITAIFMLGSFVCVASILRIPFLAQIKTSDRSWNITPAAIWVNVECNIGIVCSNLPLLRPIILKAFPPSLRSRFSISISRTSFGFSSKNSKNSWRRRAPSHKLADEEAKLGSLETGDSGNNSKGGGKTAAAAVETVRHKIEPTSLGRKGARNWFSVQGTLDGEGDEDAEEMVAVNHGRKG